MEIRSSGDFVRMTRAALAAAGFVRHADDGLVWWQSGPAGEASTLVLIHGVNDQAGTWFTVAPALARTRRVLIPDLPGHGESAPRRGPIAMSHVLLRLGQLLERERRVTLVGNSFGGWVVLLYALEHPEQVAHLVLEASGGLTRPLSSPVVASSREEALTILRAVHGPRYVPPEWVVDALVERAADSPMLRITETQQHLVEHRLGELEMPATLVWGADDGVLPLSYAEELQSRIAGAQLLVIPGAAHIPHIQQPERFLACLTAIS